MSLGATRILIADDHPVVLDGIRWVIEAEQDLTVVAEATDGLSAVEQFRNCRPDVALLDLQMPRMTGFQAMVAIREFDNRAKIIILTTYPRDVQVRRALNAGALGYLLKGSLRAGLTTAIRDVANGKQHLPHEIAHNLAENLSMDWLTSRETEVLRGVSSGASNKSIAAALNIAEDTVKGHMRSILSKLHANDRTHAVMIAIERGYLDGSHI